MTHPSVGGFVAQLPAGKDYPEDFSMEESLKTPHNTRIHSICRVGLYDLAGLKMIAR